MPNQMNFNCSYTNVAIVFTITPNGLEFGGLRSYSRQVSAVGGTFACTSRAAASPRRLPTWLLYSVSCPFCRSRMMQSILASWSCTGASCWPCAVSSSGLGAGSKWLTDMTGLDDRWNIRHLIIILVTLLLSIPNSRWTS
ncbi:hypothetical protein CI102_13582 [Trichoderma harzianum]|nr:hypothetical protein CI102_13582 [Trichoderma harzianum]